MSCACKGKVTLLYEWTSEDGSQTMEYASLVAAKAKVMRKGGSYKPKEG